MQSAMAGHLMDRDFKTCIMPSHTAPRSGSEEQRPPGSSPRSTQDDRPAHPRSLSHGTGTSLMPSLQRSFTESWNQSCMRSTWSVTMICMLGTRRSQ